jgi:hypothetical protein
MIVSREGKQVGGPDSVNVLLRDRLAGRYYAMKQLGPAGRDSDYNSRTIYCGIDRVVAIFNSGFGCDRHNWTEVHERELNACLRALNQVTESGGKEQPNSRDPNGR